MWACLIAVVIWYITFFDLSVVVVAAASVVGLVVAFAVASFDQPSLVYAVAVAVVVVDHG